MLPAARSLSRFDTRALRTQCQQQYVRENGCARSVVFLLFAVILWIFSGWRLLVNERKPEKNQRKLREPLRTANTLRCARNHSHVRTAVGVVCVTFACQIWTHWPHAARKTELNPSFLYRFLLFLGKFYLLCILFKINNKHAFGRNIIDLKAFFSQCRLAHQTSFR